MFKIPFKGVIKSLISLKILAIKVSTKLNAYIEPEFFYVTIKHMSRVVKKIQSKYGSVSFWILVNSSSEKLYISRVISRLSINKYVKVENNFDKIKPASKKPRIILIFDNDMIKVLDVFLKRMVEKRNFFIFFVTLPKNRTFQGVQPIPNSVDSLEKLLFFLVLISKY